MSSRTLGLARKISISKIEASCEEVSALLRSLSHPQRLLILGHLTKGERSVSELQDLCGISQSQLSQFLARMKAEGLVSCSRKGRFQVYAAADKRVARLIEALQAIYCH